MGWSVACESARHAVAVAMFIRFGYSKHIGMLANMSRRMAFSAVSRGVYVADAIK